MKKYFFLLCAVIATSLGACGHFPVFSNIVADTKTQSEEFPIELQPFLDEATAAAKQIAKEDDYDNWQIEYEKVKKLYDVIPGDRLNPAVQKECDGIMEQMLLGKLAIGLKKSEPWAGKKRCQDVSKEIAQRVKYVQRMKSEKSVKKRA